MVALHPRCSNTSRLGRGTTARDCTSVRHILELKHGLGTKGTVLQLDERKKGTCLTITLHETLLYIQSNSATKKMEVEGVRYAHGTYQ